MTTSSPSSSLESSPPLPPSTPSYNVNNIVHFVSVKLDSQNYLLWKSQFLAILRTHEFVGYIDGSLLCPPEFTLLDNVPHPNPDHQKWIKQDQHLASWTMATLSEPVLAQVVGPHYMSAHSLWSKIEHL